MLRANLLKATVGLKKADRVLRMDFAVVLTEGAVEYHTPAAVARAWEAAKECGASQVEFDDVLVKAFTAEDAEGAEAGETLAIPLTVALERNRIKAEETKQCTVWRWLFQVLVEDSPVHAEGMPTVEQAAGWAQAQVRAGRQVRLSL